MPRYPVLTVNLTEVIGKLIERGTPGEAVIQIVSTLPFRVVAFDEGLATDAGLSRAATRQSGLSLGDRACLALAARERLPALATDRHGRAANRRSKCA